MGNDHQEEKLLVGRQAWADVSRESRGDEGKVGHFMGNKKNGLDQRNLNGSWREKGEEEDRSIMP